MISVSMAFVESVWSILLELSPWLLLGTAIIVLLYWVLPRNMMARALRGRAGVWKAVIFGIPLPLCSCGVIPAGIGLKKQGASDGAAIGFLISTPQTGIDSILVSASMLGWPFALYKVIAALVTGLVGGTLAQSSAQGAPTALEVTGRPSLREALEHGLMVIRSIWHWLVFGVLVSAAITTWLPSEFFTMPGSTALSFLFALVISVPLYVCATASVPIAAALVAAGMPTGAALVFLMAGPATNVATIAAVRSGFGKRPFVAYLATVVVGSALFGALYELLFGRLGAKVSEHAAHHHEGAWWATASAIALLVLIAYFALSEARQRLKRSTSQTATEAPSVTLSVEGMTCQGCVGKVERALSKVPGIERVEVQLDPGAARIWGSAGTEETQAAIHDAGFKCFSATD